MFWGIKIEIFCVLRKPIEEELNYTLVKYRFSITLYFMFFYTFITLFLLVYLYLDSTLYFVASTEIEANFIYIEVLRTLLCACSCYHRETYTSRNNRGLIKDPP